MNNKKNITVIIPVYGDWSSLKVCLCSLKKHLPDNHSVLLLNDCGPEADYLEEKILKSINNKKNFIYKRNDKNLGFVKTCNRAVFELDKTDNDILLLNSDTKVTKDQDLDFEAKIFNNFLKLLKLTPTLFLSLVQTVEVF